MQKTAANSTIKDRTKKDVVPSRNGINKSVLVCFTLSIFICLLGDITLLSNLTPHIVLFGPTPTDSFSIITGLALSSSCLILLLALVEKSNLWRMTTICLTLFKLVVLLDLANNLRLGSLSSSFFESCISLTYAVVFLSVCILFCLFTLLSKCLEAPKHRTSKVLGLAAAITSSLIAYLLAVRGVIPNSPLNLLDSLFLTAVLSLFLFVTAVILTVKAKPFATTYGAKRYDLLDKASFVEQTLLVLTGCLLFTPAYVCLANSNSISVRFIDFTLTICLGALAALFVNKRWKVDVNLLFCCMVPILMTLGISRWEQLSMPCLFLIGLLGAKIVLGTLSGIDQKSNQSTKAAACALALIICGSSFGGVLLSNSQAVMPSVYVMQSIGLVFFAIFSITVLSLSETRKQLLKIAASIFLRLKSNMQLVDKRYLLLKQQQAFIVSRLNMLESILLACYLSCPILIVSNDGFLNITIVKKLLMFFGARVIGNSSSALGVTKTTVDQALVPILFLQNDSLLEKEDFYYTLDNKRKLKGKKMYTLELNTGLRQIPVLLNKNQAPCTVSK